MKKKILNNYFTCAVITVILLLLCKECYDVLLYSPDDISYRNVMSGYFTGEPNAYAYFIKYPLAKVISLLYAFSSTIPWYELFLLGCNVLCIYLILLRVFERFGPKKWMSKLIFVLLIYTICIDNIVNLEWTATAGLLAATALFRYITQKTEGRKIIRVMDSAVCLFLFILSYNLRSSVALMFLPLMLALFVVKIIYENKIQKKTYKIQFIHFCTLGILSFSLLFTLGINLYAYHSDDWSSYKEYTKNRSILVDYYGYPDYDTNKEIYEQAGISKEAYEIIKSDYNLIFLNDEFQNYRYEEIANFSKDMYSETKLSDRIDKAVDRIYRALSDEKVIVISVIIAALLIYNLFSTKKKLVNVIFATIAVFWGCGLYGYLGFSGRLPVRVAITISYGIIAVLLGTFCLSIKKERNMDFEKKFCTWVTDLLILCLVALTAFNSLLKLRLQNEEDTLNALARYELLESCSQYPENVYFLDFNSFTQYGERVGATLDFSSGNCINAGGWTYSTPFYKEFLEKHDINSLLQSIKEKENIYFLVGSERGSYVFERIDSYFKTIDADIKVELVDQFTLVNGKEVDSLHFVYNKK